MYCPAEMTCNICLGGGGAQQINANSLHYTLVTLAYRGTRGTTDTFFTLEFQHICLTIQFPIARHMTFLIASNNLMLQSWQELL